MKKLLLIGMLTTSLSISAHATCGAANCPIINFTPLSSNKWELSLGYEYINQDQVYVGDKRSTIGAIPSHHDEVQTINRQYNLAAKYTLSPEWRIRLELPYIQRTHKHIHNHNGGQHFEEWQLDGLGDTNLFVDHLFSQSDTSKLALTLGLKLPTGKTGIKNDHGTIAEPNIQPGSGSVDYYLGLFLQHGIATVPNLQKDYVMLPINIAAVYTIPTPGTDGWQFGNRLLASIGTSYLISDKVSLDLDIFGKYQDIARAGNTHEDAGNTGGKWLYITPSVDLRLSKIVSVKTQIQYPLWQDVNGIQIVAPWNLRMDVNFRF